MGTGPTTVRAAADEDLDNLATTLGRAFHDDPIMSWILPDEGSRTARLTAMFGLLARHTHLPGGGVELAHPDGTPARVTAAALWDPPGGWRVPLTVQIRQGPAFLRVFSTRLPAAMRALTRTERNHPHRPHWYLFAIGTDPTAQGHGLGGALLNSRLRRCDAEGLPAYLECSAAHNVAFYEKYGFTVIRELPMPGTCPPVWPMWREPH
jgi:GNAT superfamily N-acetyltransferase